MRPPIDGGIILLTGASSGIGLDMAKLLAPRAARLILVARRRDRLEKLAAELRAAHSHLAVDVEPCDLCSLEQTETLADRLLAKHGAIDVLINNAGFGDVGLFEHSEPRKILEIITVNISALTLLTRKVLPPMIARRKGGILNVSSGYGLTWMPLVAVYCATKHYVTAFTDSLRTELKGSGVVVSQLCPGPTPTEFNHVAGSPVDMPALFRLSSARVASAGIARFGRGHALIVPGLLIRLMIYLASRTPRWMLRLAYGPLGSIYRKRFSGNVSAAA